MVERYRFICRTIVFGHRKCSRGTGYVSGHRKQFRATPNKLYGPNGPRERQTSPKRGWCAPYRPNRRRRKGRKGRRKGEDSASPFPSPPPSLSFPPPMDMEGGRPTWRRRPSRITPTWGAPYSPSPCPTYIYVGGAPLEHTTLIPSRVRRPPPQFTPQVICRSA